MCGTSFAKKVRRLSYYESFSLIFYHSTISFVDFFLINMYNTFSCTPELHLHMKAYIPFLALLSELLDIKAFNSFSPVSHVFSVPSAHSSFSPCLHNIMSLSKCPRSHYPPPVISTTVDILIANGGPSDAIKVPYKLDEPISCLIKNILAKIGTDSSSTSSQALFINGRRLKDHAQTLAYYRILDRVLIYRTLPSQTHGNKCNISILMVIPNGNVMPLTCHAETIVKEVKQLIKARLGISSDLQKLTYDGFQPEDARLLKYYGIVHGSTFYLTLFQPSDETLPGTVFLVNLGDCMGVRKVQIPTCAIQGRAASPRANVECQYKCTPSHKVICQKALGTLEVPFNCPNCNSSDNNTPVAVGFWKYKYRFHGNRCISRLADNLRLESGQEGRLSSLGWC